MDNDKPQPYTHGSLPQPVVDNAAPEVAVNTPMSDVSAQPAVVPAQGAQQVPSAPAPQDSDVLEVGWINQVDHLVKQKVSDPRALSQEFAKLKAQYIASRYGKEIKTDGKG